jgi:hypothetical protein
MVWKSTNNKIVFFQFLYLFLIINKYKTNIDKNDKSCFSLIRSKEQGQAYKQE